MKLKKYDILASWTNISSKGRYSIKTRWHRGVQATSLTTASEQVLANYSDKICPGISMGWEIRHDQGTIPSL